MTATCFLRLTGGPYPSNAIPYEPNPEQLDWPPPDLLVVLGLQGQVMGLCDYEKFPEDKRDEVVVYKKISQSDLTPEQVEGSAHIARAAEYELDRDPMKEDRP